MKRFFITGTGTGVGKTLVTCALAYQLRKAGKNIASVKPVASGYDANDAQSDTALIVQSLGLDAPSAENISPWRYAAPLAPDMAAAKERKPPVDVDALMAFCNRQNADIVLVEGVGGVMSPLNDRHTVLDWMEALGWPLILVTGSYLGAISHALTALEILANRGLVVPALILSEAQDNVVNMDDMAASLKKFLPPDTAVVKIPRLRSPEPWKNAPDLTGLCE